jgi:thiol-disulfide isomerase/thioredoxin
MRDKLSAISALLAGLLLGSPSIHHPAVAHRPFPGEWRAVLDLAGGPLRFSLRLSDHTESRICNGSACSRIPAARLIGDSLLLEIPDYAATIVARLHQDSLTGTYHNVGRRGPRTLPFRASRGRWPVETADSRMLGRWDATFTQDGRTSPRVLEFQNDAVGLEGAVISNTGDYGQFWGRAHADSFSLGHFDGSFIYMITGRIDGDTLRGVFHAGLSTQTPWVAVRSTGAPHLKAPNEVIQADTSTTFHFNFPDLSGRPVRESDPRFRGKVIVVDIFGTWCPTCHEAAPTLVSLWNEYHGRGLEIVGLAYEVTGDSAVDGKQVRLFRDKFRIPYPLLLAGITDAAAAAATQPQLQGPIAFPTTIFIGRDGRVREVHAGFYGPATGEQHQRLVRELHRKVEGLLAE